MARSLSPCPPKLYTKMAYTTAKEFITDAERQEVVELVYDSVYSTSNKHVEGRTRETGGNDWVRVITDSASTYTVVGYGYHAYTIGDVIKNGRRVGEFVSARSIKQ